MIYKNSKITLTNQKKLMCISGKHNTRDIDKRKQQLSVILLITLTTATKLLEHRLRRNYSDISKM